MRTGRVGRIFFVDWTRTPSAADREPFLAAATEARRQAGRPLISLQVIRAGTGLPSREAREAMIDAQRVFEVLVEAHYVAVEVPGITGAVIRGVLAAVGMAQRRDSTVTATLDEAVALLCRRHGLDPAATREALRAAGLLD